MFTLAAVAPQAFAAGTTGAVASSGPKTSGSSPAPKSFDLICSPNDSGTASKYNFATCLNNIYIFAIGLGSFVAVLMFVLAGYMYMSGKQQKAKEFIGSTILGLIILFGSYIFLNAIDPNLTNINVEPLSAVNCSGNKCVIPTTPLETVSSGSQTEAQLLLQLADQGSVILANGTDCPPNGPELNLNAIKQGQDAQYDGPGKECNKGTTSIDVNMLTTLVQAADNGYKITITSLTSGHHASANDPHYQGEAVDLIPSTSDNAVILKLVQILTNGGAKATAVECNLATGHQFLVLNGSNDNKALDTCKGKNGYHIHSQWTSLPNN